MWEDKDGQWMIILGGLVSLIACIYFTKEWLDHKIEMVKFQQKAFACGAKFFFLVIHRDVFDR
jgi:hypothetical protein